MAEHFLVPEGAEPWLAVDVWLVLLSFAPLLTFKKVGESTAMGMRWI